LTTAIIGNCLKCPRSCSIIIIRKATPKNRKGPKQEHTRSQKEKYGQNGEKYPKRIEQVSAVEVSCAEDAA
jgi:hypothetical protein